MSNNLILSLRDLLSTNTYIAAALVAASTALCGVFSYHCYLSFPFAGEVPICWSWVPILGDAIEFGKQPIEFMLNKSRKVKQEIIGVLLAGERIFLINDPDSYSTIFKVDKTKFSFDVFANQVTCNVFGVPESVCKHANDMNTEAEARAGYQKYLLHDSGCDDITARMLDKMHSMSEELVINLFRTDGGASAQGAPVVNLLTFINDFVYRASVAALFNSEIADDKAVFDSFMSFDSVFALAVTGMPVYNERLSSYFGTTYAADRERVVDCIMRVVDKSGPFIAHRSDMYSKIDISNRDIARYQLAMVWAGTGNTMPGCYWTLYFLLMNPDAMKAVQAELSSVLGDRIPSVDMCMDAADLPQMVVLDSCISEALRLMSGSLMMRQVVAPEGGVLTLNSGKSYRFRRGDKVGLFPALVHYDEDFYPDAKTFHYDRFLSPDHKETLTSITRQSNGTSTSVSVNSCFIPFGGGGHYCPGRKFARNEIKTVIAYLVANFNLDLLVVDPPSMVGNSAGVEYDGSRAGLGIFPPKTGVDIKIAPRK